MAKINIILQGFVDINLEIDENINTRIINSIIKPISNLDVNLDTNLIAENLTQSKKVELPVSIESLFKGFGININSIQNLHLQGSRIYGVNNINSDWDLSAISTEVIGHEFREVTLDGNNFDIHLFSIQEFQNRLNNHEMREIETLSHPDEFIIIDNKSFFLKIDNNKLIEKVKSESDILWNMSKKILESGGDSHIALKNIWHSFRFLIFAEQILKTGSITDFTSANYLYNQIVKSKRTNFDYFELNFSVFREALKLNLETFRDDNELEFVEFKI